MKRRQLEKKLSALGWIYERHGRKHDIWTNGKYEIAVPRHKEINEYTANAILKKAKGGPR
jgi:mRNA interferase HicA